MNARLLLVGTALLLLAGEAYGEGAYQRTKDGKTRVWNPEPKASDVATWSGDRDKQRCAAGYGTITWYRLVRKYGLGAGMGITKEIPVIRYSGNMVAGKLEGPVTAVNEQGKTSHATFVDGVRTGDWVEGRGPAVTAHQSPAPKKAESPIAAEGEKLPNSESAQGPDRSKAEATAESSPVPEPPLRAEPVHHRNVVASTPTVPTPSVPPEPAQPRREESPRQDVAVNTPTVSASAMSPVPEQHLPENPIRRDVAVTTPTIPTSAASPVPEQHLPENPVRRDVAVTTPTIPTSAVSPVPEQHLPENPVRRDVAVTTPTVPTSAVSPIPEQHLPESSVRRDVAENTSAATIPPITLATPSALREQQGEPSPADPASRLLPSPTPPATLPESSGRHAGDPPSVTAADPPASQPSASPSPDSRPLSRMPGPGLRRRGRPDDLLRSLTLPPASLGIQTNPFPTMSSSSSLPSSSPSPSAHSTLSSSEVVALANAEARMHGYALGDYEAPQAQYTATDDTWTVVYDRKSTDDRGGAGKRFSITVEDKTKKAALKQ